LKISVNLDFKHSTIIYLAQSKYQAFLYSCMILKNEKKSRLKLLNETLLAKRRFGGQRRHYQATNCLKEEKKTNNSNR
jgi:hypothetical protein